MAEDTTIDELGWSAFIDRLAGPLRLERPERQAYGLLMTLHLVGEIWGDLALLRAAARFAAHHHFALEPAFGAKTDQPRLAAWYGAFLRRQAEETEPFPHTLMKPAWTAKS